LREARQRARVAACANKASGRQLVRLAVHHGSSVHRVMTWTCRKCYVMNWQTHAWCHRCWAAKADGKSKSSATGKGKSYGGWSSASSSWQPSTADVQQSDQEVALRTRSSIADLTKSLNGLPKDEDCVPAVLAIKENISNQIKHGNGALRTMKPLGVRIQRTEAFLAKKQERLGKSEEELGRLNKEWHWRPRSRRIPSS
jgi:hypothetical protein